MARSVWPWIVAGTALLLLGGCGFHERAERPAWRAQAENACLAEGHVTVSAFVQPAAEINGPGICGLAHPFKVTALAGGTILLNAPQTLDCSMIPVLDRWLAEVVQPAAQANFGQPLVSVRAFGSYSCRGINHNSSGKYSEHAFGNAIDIAAFRLADGREISVLRGWNGGPAEQAFLRNVHAGACGLFTTVLGPGYPQHDNHFHVDLAMHGSTSRGLRTYCEPTPRTPPPVGPKRDDLPEPPPLQEEIDVAQAGSGNTGIGAAPGPDASVPPDLMGYQRADAPASRPPTDLPEGSPSDWDATSSIRGGD